MWHGKVIFFVILELMLSVSVYALNCDMVKTKTEKIICGNNDLLSLDQKLNGIYEKVIQNLNKADALILRDQQKLWIEGRNKKIDFTDLATYYDERISTLSKYLNEDKVEGASHLNIKMCQIFKSNNSIEKLSNAVEQWPKDPSVLINGKKSYLFKNTNGMGTCHDDELCLVENINQKCDSEKSKIVELSCYDDSCGMGRDFIPFKMDNEVYVLAIRKSTAPKYILSRADHKELELAFNTREIYYFDGTQLRLLCESNDLKIQKTVLIKGDTKYCEQLKSIREVALLDKDISKASPLANYSETDSTWQLHLPFNQVFRKKMSTQLAGLYFDGQFYFYPTAISLSKNDKRKYTIISYQVSSGAGCGCELENLYIADEKGRILDNTINIGSLVYDLNENLWCGNKLSIVSANGTIWIKKDYQGKYVEYYSLSDANQDPCIFALRTHPKFSE